ncbi:MAG: ArsR/SmtB family transcription factor [Streptosporangiaceae bacterium]
MNQLDAAFTALTDPTRRAIVTRLARGDATVNELAAPFDMTRPAISQHLKVLERCGLISRTRRAQFRPCHLERQALDAAMSWIEENRRIWAQRFDKLDAHLRDIQGVPAPEETAPHGAPSPPGAAPQEAPPAPGAVPLGGSAPPGAAPHGTSRPPETAPRGAPPPAGAAPQVAPPQAEKGTNRE